MAELGVPQWMLACGLLLLCSCEVLPAASAASTNYYDTLNVAPTASDRQIKKAFRILAVKYHPDKNKSADAEKTFREVAEAYKVLSNKEKRRLYDRIGHKAFLKNEVSGPEQAHQTDFPFHSEDAFHDFDDGPFWEDEFMWSFDDDAEDGDGPYEHYSFAEPGFGFVFGDEDEDNQHYF